MQKAILVSKLKKNKGKKGEKVPKPSPVHLESLLLFLGHCEKPGREQEEKKQTKLEENDKSRQFRVSSRDRDARE